MTRIIVFAKAPIAGLAKTRLIPKLGAQAAARLHSYMVERMVNEAVAARLGEVVLACTPSEEHALFRSIAHALPVKLMDQGTGDLGARMHRAIKTGLDTDVHVLIVGTDCPGLDAAYLTQAARALETGRDVVIGPAEDGGYVLIGARVASSAMFSDIAWSTPSVMAQTRQALAACGLSWFELSSLWDVDRPEDFERLEREFPLFAHASFRANGHNPTSTSLEQWAAR